MWGFAARFVPRWARRVSKRDSRERRLDDGTSLVTSRVEHAFRYRIPVAEAGVPVVTWTFELRQTGSSKTRLVVRVRGSSEYPFQNLPMWFVTAVVPIIHFIMERKQLLSIRRRVERNGHADWNSDTL